MQMMLKHIFSLPLSTVLACMLPGLHTFKLLFYAESVGGMVISGHVTKMAVTPFDPQLPNPPVVRKRQNSTGVIADTLICGNREFRVYFATNSGKY